MWNDANFPIVFDSYYITVYKNSSGEIFIHHKKVNLDLRITPNLNDLEITGVYQVQTHSHSLSLTGESLP